MPAPTTTGGSLMGYPTTVDANTFPAPSIFGSDFMLNCSTSAGAAVTAGAIYFTPYNLTTFVTVTSMRTDFSGSPTGNIDMGIYDSTGSNGNPGTLLGHTGAIAASTGVYTQNLTANLTLSPGKYWVAFVDNVADSIFSRGTGTNAAPDLRSSSTGFTTLQSTAPTLINTNLVFLCFGLLSGSWS